MSDAGMQKYRPISNFKVTSKLLERLVASQLINEVSTRQQAAARSPVCLPCVLFDWNCHCSSAFWHLHCTRLWWHCCTRPARLLCSILYGRPPDPTSSPAEVVRAKRIGTRVVHVVSEPTPTVRVSPRQALWDDEHSVRSAARQRSRTHSVRFVYAWRSPFGWAVRLQCPPVCRRHTSFRPLPTRQLCTTVSWSRSLCERCRTVDDNLVVAYFFGPPCR